MFRILKRPLCTCQNKLNTSGIDDAAEREAEKIRRRFEEVTKPPPKPSTEKEYAFKRDRERVQCFNEEPKGKKK